MKKQFDRNRIRYKAKKNKGLNFPKALPPLEPQDYED